MAEACGYRDALKDILEYFDGRRVLYPLEVSKYTGVDPRTALANYPFVREPGKKPYIAATTLARVLCGGGKKR